MRARRAILGKPKNLMSLESPGESLLFDIDKNLADEVSDRFNVNRLVESLKGKDEKNARAAMEKFGKELMRLVIELADNKYPERTGEMVEKVAKLTGVSFPHRFERYVEISLWGSRPQDRWNVRKATPKELVFQIYSCAVHQKMKEQGLQYRRFPCQALCLASFKVAAQKTGDPVKVGHKKTLPKAGMCEFIFTV